MNKKPNILKLLCIVSFILVVLTSIPLFIMYLTGNSAGSNLITDIHVWFGAAFIIFALVRIIKSRGVI